MLVEIVLEEEPEDPVNSIQIREIEKGIFEVAHVLDSRGTPDVVQSFKVESLDYIPEEERREK